MSFLNPNSITARASSQYKPPAPMDPNQRLSRYGPIQPMARRPSLLERLLFS